jgi:hypothetical protein
MGELHAAPAWSSTDDQLCGAPSILAIFLSYTNVLIKPKKTIQFVLVGELSFMYIYK